MARPHGKTASTSRDRDVSPPEYRQYGTGNPGALSRGTQKKRAEQIAKHSQRMLADLEEEAENKWHLQNPVQAAIRRGRCFDEREPQSVPNDGAADGHRDQQAGPSTSARNDRNNDYAAGRSDGVALRGSSNVLTPTIRPGPSRRTEGGQRRASSNNGNLSTNASGSTVSVSEVAAGGTIIRKDPNADEKIKEDRARRERLKQPRPEEVYAALERKDVLDMSDLNHLAQLHVVAGIVGLRQLSQDAMSQIFLVTSKGVKAKDLVPVLWFLCFEKNGDVAELKGWVWQKLRLENMCGDLTYCLDFRAKLADSDFWIYMFDLVRGILLEKGVTGIEEFIRFFWTRGSPR